MKVPFMVAGPGIKPSRTDALVYLHDIFPTMVDYGGGKLAEKHDGQSIRPIIEGKKQKVREFLTLAYQGTQRSIRNDEWKLMVFPRINKHQLFNLTKDPQEMYDVAAQYPEKVKQLTEQLKAQQKILGDKEALSVKTPAKAEFTVPNVKPYPRHKAGGESKRQTSD